MKCGPCQIEFKSYLKLQFHKAKVHGERNQMSRWASPKDFQSGRKERLKAAEERLKEKISRWRYYNG